MGDYYSLRFTAALNNEGEERVRTLLRTHSWEGVHDVFSQMNRASFIPFGALNYEPDGWEYACNLQTVGPTPVWHVCCSIKTAGRATVEYFLGHVLPPMLSLETKVEWWSEVSGETRILFVHPDGQVVEVLESQQQPTS